MAIKDFIRTQFIEVIEWLDDSGNTLVFRFPVEAQEIKMGARLTVREGQSAIFVNQGKLGDVFKPGFHQLSTRNLPILTKLLSWKHGFNSPFKAEVYFVSTRQFTDQKWGTANPVIIRDPELGPLRLRAFGTYSFRVNDPATFMKEVFGTMGLFTTEEITGQLRGLAISGFSDLLGECRIPVFDLASNYDELSDQAKQKLDLEFKKYGLELSKFYVENISLPPEVEDMIDKRASMGVVGDMNRYTQFQTAQAIEKAAENQGGTAGAGVGIGAGVAMGHQMMGTMQSAPQGAAVAQTTHPQVNTIACIKCSESIPQGSKFCSHCGAPQTARCAKCEKSLVQGAKFCPNCGEAVP